jgi:hypothetical protein
MPVSDTVQPQLGSSCPVVTLAAVLIAHVSQSASMKCTAVTIGCRCALEHNHTCNTQQTHPASTCRWCGKAAMPSNRTAGAAADATQVVPWGSLSATGALADTYKGRTLILGPGLW